MGYSAVKISDSMKAKLDADKGGDETRDEQIKRLLNGNETPPHPESIERRLAAIENVLDDVQQERSEGMVKRIERLEASVEQAKDDIEYVREYVEARA